MEKELKKELETLIKKNKIVVGVEQNTDDNYNKINKMVLKNVWKEEKTNIFQLMSFLYSKTIIKSYNIRIRYNYNYNDKQVISITQTYTNYDGTLTKTRYTFYNIPTNLGYLDTYKISKEVFKND